MAVESIPVQERNTKNMKKKLFFWKDNLNVVFVSRHLLTILKVDHISVMLYYLVLAPAQLYIKPGQF